MNAASVAPPVGRCRRVSEWGNFRPAKWGNSEVVHFDGLSDSCTGPKRVWMKLDTNGGVNISSLAAQSRRSVDRIRPPSDCRNRIPPR
jgi:hypothetical protein